MTFLLIMICVTVAGEQDCEWNFIDQYESMEECEVIKGVLDNEINRYLIPNVKVLYQCDGET